MKRFYHKSVITVIYLLLAMGLIATPVLSAPSNPTFSWEYQWGDESPFPYKESQPITTDKISSTHWKTIDFPSNPPGRGKQNFIWFRTVLPPYNLKDPVFFIYSVDLIFEAFLEDKRIYQFGNFDPVNGFKFIGWPWHAIPLPINAAGKYLYFRVYSNYQDIGLWGETLLMEKSAQIEHIIRGNYKELTVAAFSLIIGLLGITFFFISDRNRQVGYLSIFATATAMLLGGENQAIQLFWNHPLLQRYIALIGYLLLPVCISQLLAEWSKEHFANIMRGLSQFNFMFLILSIGMSCIGLISLASIYPAFDVVFALSLLITFLVAWKQFSDLKSKQRYVMLAFIIFALYLLLDMAIAHSLIPWINLDRAPGAFIFIIVMVLISLYQHYSLQTQLKELNQGLEQRIQQRTASLHRLLSINKEHTELVSMLHNMGARMSELIMKIQNTDNTACADEILDQELVGVLQPLRTELLKQGKQPKSHHEKEKPISIDHGYYPISIRTIDGKAHPYRVLKVNFLSTHPPQQADKEILNGYLQRSCDQLSSTLSNVRLREELNRYSLEDPLTELNNRRYIDQVLPEIISVAKQKQQPLTLLLCDIDHFKTFNDRFGHEAGDEALIFVAACLKKHFEGSGIPCRMGGEEFLVLLPNHSETEGLHLANTFLQRISKMHLNFQGQSLGNITLSIGVTGWNGTGPISQEMIKQADQALYQAKRSGRNKVVRYDGT